MAIRLLAYGPWWEAFEESCWSMRDRNGQGLCAGGTRSLLPSEVARNQRQAIDEHVCHRSCHSECPHQDGAPRGTAYANVLEAPHRDSALLHHVSGPAMGCLLQRAHVTCVTADFYGYRKTHQSRG